MNEGASHALGTCDWASAGATGGGTGAGGGNQGLSCGHVEAEMPIRCPLEMSGWRSEPVEGSRRELSTNTSMAFKATGLGGDLCRQWG